MGFLYCSGLISLPYQQPGLRSLLEAQGRQVVSTGVPWRPSRCLSTGGIDEVYEACQQDSPFTIRFAAVIC